jgi:hypothetical protein
MEQLEFVIGQCEWCKAHGYNGDVHMGKPHDHQPYAEIRDAIAAEIFRKAFEGKQ